MHITPRVSHPLSGNLSVSVFFFPLPLKRNLLLEPSKKKKINGHRFPLHSEGRESKSRGKGDKTTGKQGKQLGYSVRAVMSIQTWWFIRRGFGLCVYEDYIFKKYTSRDWWLLDHFMRNCLCAIKTFSGKLANNYIFPNVLINQLYQLIMIKTDKQKKIWQKSLFFYMWREQKDKQ